MHINPGTAQASIRSERRPALVAALLALGLGGAFLPQGVWPAPLPQENFTRADVARFQERANAALLTSGAAKGYWGVLVTDADTGEVLYALNPARYFTPASNVKLFTTVLALAALGRDFRIHTTIETLGHLDRSGVLRGDLVLVGRGDANLSNRTFPYSDKAPRVGPPETVLAAMVDQVVAAGVKQIDGDVVADDTYFVPARFPPGWTVDDTVWSYGAAVSSISVNDNSLNIEVKPADRAGAPLRYRIDPASRLYDVRNEATTTAARTEPQLRLSRDPESRVFVLGGTLPVGAAPRELSVAVTEPAENAADLLARLLEARGIRISGHSRANHPLNVAAGQSTTPPPSSPTILAEHVSPPLIEDVLLTNKISQNLHAEMMLRVAAREKAAALTLDDAVKFAAQFYQSIGLAPDDVLLADGSGLSRNDLVTPQSVVQLLAYAVHQPWGEDFLTSLPIAAADGTLANRMKSTSAAGRIRAKSGTFDRVDSLSGYATTLAGEHLIFAMFGNNIGTRNRDAAAILDALCAAMVEELGATSPPPGPLPDPASSPGPSPAPNLDSDPPSLPAPQ
jgi:serine-type D-Ala-D-Ala carboxypeptidase/endopeptidase (penicillin-binding protein 4)